jgi:hypothetical protein
MTKKNCVNSEKLQEYLDNNLNSEESRQVGDHIASCSECRQQLDGLKAVYSHAATYAKKQLSQSPDSKRINHLMSDIQKETLQSKKTEPKKSLRLLEFLTQNTGWFIVPAMALVLLWVFFPASEIDNNKNEVIKFNLAKNRVNIVFADDQAKVSIDSEQVKISEVKHIPINKKINLPAESIIIIKSGKNGFQLSEQAVFTFKNNSIDLEHGKVECKLQGKHEGFLVKTQFAEVLPLGTSFNLTVTDWYCRINLKSGKLKITSLTGQHRIIETRQVIYVDKNGNFLTDLQQSETDQVNKSQNQSTSGYYGDQPKPVSPPASAPRQLIDSF